MSSLKEELENRWSGFWNNPDAKFKILSLGLALILLLNNVYDLNQLEDYKKAFSMNQCFNNFGIEFNNTTVVINNTGVNLDGIFSRRISA